ncbi:MAG TPA: DUF4307 domain-containing protein [Micromonosporaceae bacterium]
MTETPATPPPGTPPSPRGAPSFPPGRYGRRRAQRPRRTWAIALLVVAVLAVTSLVAVRLYRMYGDPVYRADVITYTDATDTQLVVTFRVTLPPGGAANCVLRARARDGAEVGRAEVRVDAPPGQTQVTTSHRLATSRRAFVGEVLRCRPPA